MGERKTASCSPYPDTCAQNTHTHTHTHTHCPSLHVTINQLAPTCCLQTEFPTDVLRGVGWEKKKVELEAGEGEGGRGNLKELKTLPCQTANSPQLSPPPSIQPNNSLTFSILHEKDKDRKIFPWSLSACLTVSSGAVVLPCAGPINVKGELILSASFSRHCLINWLTTTPTEYLMPLLPLFFLHRFFSPPLLHLHILYIP